MKESENIISILVPIYNTSKYLSRCLDSLYGQTYDNIEIVLVDDKSTDDSCAILQAYIDSHPTKKIVKIIKHDKNRGLAAARMTGIVNAKGKWLMFVDSDDYLELNAAKILMEHIRSNQSEVVLFGYNIVYSDRIIPQLQTVNNTPSEYLWELLSKRKSNCYWNKMFNRSLFVENGIYPIEGINQGEDYVVIPRIIYYAHKITVLDKILYNYDRTNETAYTKNFTSTHIEQLKKADNILFDFFSSKIKNDEISKLKMMRVRTILYMFKIAKPENFSLIRQSYSLPKGIEYSKLSITDIMTICAIQNKMYILIRLINSIRNFFLSKISR